MARATRGWVLEDARTCGEGAIRRVSFVMEVAELVDAARRLGRRKKMAGWVSATRLQAFHTPLGAAPVRAPPQISMVVVGEVTCRRAGRTGDKAVSRLRSSVEFKTRG